MIPSKRRRLAAAAAGFILLAGAVVLALTEGPKATLPPRAADERPQLLLLTSLPILFPEDVTLESKALPVLSALESRYAVIPISLADHASLQGRRLLLMVQPQAQPAEVLVQLDHWVRSGGRVLLLADVALEWPSSRPLGSPLRPPLSYPDTGLLGHWGLRLDAPDALGPKTVTVGKADISTASPGTLVATSSNCSVEAGFVAHCRIGQGEATVIADADFINAPESQSANFDLLLRELDLLEH